MKLALCCANGELKYGLTRVELFDIIMNETKHMNEGDVLLVYTMNNDSMIIDKNIISIILEDGKLTIYNELDNIEKLLKYECLNYNYYYILLSGMLAEYELKQSKAAKESYTIEQEQFEQAEEENKKAVYNVYAYGKSLCFTGENAYNSVHDFILAVVSTEDDETGVVTVDKDGRGLDIGYAKGKYNIFLRVSDDNCKWEIFEKGDRHAISEFIRNWVLL